MVPKMFVLEIVPRLQQEQARTISKQKAKCNWFSIIFWFENPSTRRYIFNRPIQTLIHEKE